MNANAWNGADEWGGGKWPDSSTRTSEATTANCADARDDDELSLGWRSSATYKSSPCAAADATSIW